ncbi:conserved hypothetical protein [Uncinocarpus reesii 1704]|uniref:Zinc finger ZPR1-type domain-containing protein n=1 Tax=Uncinocarpus reesii (strain UAMH 1704) TaxID=336963 RepID=C4JQ92_UNCRE|nr:uncharacterized protein UREG_04646 [Uncinocarpus reesii 1704]EEP79800.1 conserved hypothetical protein [Uncinocarpus reesii 1704]
MASSEDVDKSLRTQQESSAQHLAVKIEERPIENPGEKEDAEAEDDVGPMQLESLCMNCHENGVTKILLLRIPFFRDVLLESFECPHCFFKNNSIKAAGQIQEQGAKYTLEVESPGDLERQVIKSDSAIFRLDTLGIEMPKGEGQLTNVEGILSKILEQLESDQPARKTVNPELYQSLETIIQKLKKILNRESFPFSISLDDPSGNSWIAPAPHDEGNKYQRKDYARTREQNEELGLAAEQESGNMKVAAGDPKDLDIVDGVVYSLPAECPGCTKQSTVNMQKVDIPHFKEVFIWSTVCDHCGYRTNEVKTGGAVPEKGRRIRLQVESVEDLSRDILKSDTCAVSSDELDLSVQPGTLGGRFTTVEGLLTQVRDQLHGQIFEIGDEDLAPGDSMATEEKATWERFFSKLDAAIKGEMKFKIVLEDPLANSYVQNLHTPNPDLQLHIEDYTRTDEEEDELGLKDMKTEGYEQDATAVGEES